MAGFAILVAARCWLTEQATTPNVGLGRVPTETSSTSETSSRPSPKRHTLPSDATPNCFLPYR
jgi:hypothetical protein